MEMSGVQWDVLRGSNIAGFHGVLHVGFWSGEGKYIKVS